MSVLSRIAYYRNRRDDVPNQELARDLAATKDRAGVREIAENLWNKNKSVQSDCLKVLYETGYLDPELIADHAGDFLKLLKSRNNRMVWGGMIALSTIAELRPAEIWGRIDDVIDAVDKGSVITVVSGGKVLARVASKGEEYRARIFPVLLGQLKTCIPRDVPTHAESILPAVDDGNRHAFLSVVESRRSELTPSQLTRLKRVLKALDKR
jgi:hypothetical protein